MRRSLGVLVFSLSVLLLAGIGDVAQALDPNDDFDDGVLDTTKWVAVAGTGASVVETGGRLLQTVNAGEEGQAVGALVRSTYRLRDSFDIQVDYALLAWPEHNHGTVTLTASPYPDDFNAMVRFSGGAGEVGGTGELYLAAFALLSGGAPAGMTPTTHMAGKLRLVRDEGSVLSGYFWQESTQEWVLVHSQLVSASDYMVMLQCYGVLQVPTVVVAFDNFQVNSGQVVPMIPVIEDVVIDRGRDTDWWDWAHYHQRVTVQVKGSEYEQPGCLLISDPEGSRYVMPTCGMGSWYDPLGANPGLRRVVEVTVGPDYTYTYTWYDEHKRLSPAAGSYEIGVIGTAGSWPTLTTAVAPVVPEAGPVLTGPAADSVIDNTVPTFQWLSPPGSESWLQLRAEGGMNYTGPVADDWAEIWRAYVGQQTEAVYNFDGSGPDLEPGRTYYWQISGWTAVDDRVTDPRVAIWTRQTALHRFTEYAPYPEALPILPGILVWSQAVWDRFDWGESAVAGYSPEPWTRWWLSALGGECPDVSWDGTRLLLSLEGCLIEHMDGSPGTRVPGIEGAYDTRWSPDSERLTFTAGNDVFMVNVDGSDLHPLLASSDSERYADWSPDGKWLAYRRIPSGEDLCSVWLIRPDGTDDHPLVATGASGYPGYIVESMADPAWSPDATRLAVGFTLTLADGTGGVAGIGTIAPEGGVLTPVFVAPPGYVCCASPKQTHWSPDGASIVFFSGHHLAPDPEWANGKFEHGVEMWVIDADGSGSPTRLTYNYAHDSHGTWWAPNTLVGKDVSIVKGDATVTFEHVTTAGSTRMSVTDDVPGPVPEGYAFVGDLWEGATTAEIQGGITIALHYGASLAGQENRLAVMQWEEAKGKWQDKTARPIDKANRIIRARTSSLGTFAVAMKIT